MLENAVAKGEIACCEQFLLFLQCFQKACFPGVSKGVIVWEWLKSLNISFERVGKGCQKWKKSILSACLSFSHNV